MTNTTRTPARVLAELRRVRAQLDKLGPRRDELLAEGRALGVPSPQLAEAAGVSDSRVRQLAPAGASSQLVAAQLLAELPRLPEGVPLVSEHASVTTRQPWPARVSAWVELDSKRGKRQDGHVFVLEGTHPRALLDGLPHDVARVFLCGPAPQGAGSSHAERVRSWGMLPAGDAWTIAPAGHYTADTDAPVFRWEHVDGRRVEVLHASSWFGDVGAIDAWNAWTVLNAEVAKAFPGGVLLSTPATTGRDLWRRTIPAGKSFPVMSDQLRELIATTSGQGRAELLPAPTKGATVDSFAYLDGRLMYAALTWGMPVGEPTPWKLAGAAAADNVDTLAKRGRWLVTATVPEGWAHVGILPAQREGGGWRYPSTPGETFASWVDASEAQLAVRHGWDVRLHDGFTWAEGKPLNVWTDKLVTIWQRLQAGGDVSRIAARGVRSMLLFAIGAFAGRTHMVTRSCPLEDTSSVPDNARARVVGDRLVWEQPAPVGAWAASMAHPEWSAQIWARARVRLLDAPDGAGGRVGALHLPRAAVIAFRTDALYLDGAPDWHDDGRPGRFRSKGQLHVPAPWPATNDELFQLRDRAEEGENR